MRRFLSLVMAWGFGLFFLGCDEPSPAAQKQQGTFAAPKSPQSAGSATPGASTPETHLDARFSAYGTKLFLFGEELVLTTPTRLLRLRPGKKAQEVPAQLGEAATLHEDSIAYFRDGTIRMLSLVDSKESVRLHVEHHIQYILSSGPRLAWLSHERDGLYFLQTESAGSIETLYKSKSELIWPVVRDETVYFIERLSNGWKLGRAPMNGSGVTFGNEHQSRVPSMLASGPDGIYLYDGPELGVRRFSFSLDDEESFAKEVICSPLSVSNRVLCAQVGGVLEIARPGAEPRPMTQEAGGPIASIMADEERVYWVVDRGPERMMVRSAALPKL